MATAKGEASRDRPRQRSPRIDSLGSWPRGADLLSVLSVDLPTNAPPPDILAHDIDTERVARGS